MTEYRDRLDSLVECARRSVRRLVRLGVCHPQDAADLLAESFAGLMRAATEYDGRRVEWWKYANYKAHKAVIDAERRGVWTRGGRRRERTAVTYVDFQDEVHLHPAAVADFSGDPDREFPAAARRLIRDLTPGQQAAVIADCTGASPPPCRRRRREAYIALSVMWPDRAAVAAILFD